jgi:hypothetical protein
MVGAVVPVAPAIGEAVVAASLFLAWLVAFGLLFVYRSTLGAIALGLANRIEGIGISTRIGSIHPFGPLADAIRFVDNEIRDGLGWAVANTERAASWLFHTATAQIRAIGDTVGGLAYDLSHALDRTVTVTIPHAVGVAERRGARALGKVRALAVATAATIAHELPKIHGRLRSGERVMERLGRRVKRLEKAFAPAAFAALVVAAFVRLGLGVLRCPRFLKAAKRTCGMDPSLLESMLLDTTMILGAISLVEFAHELQSVVEPVESGIRHLIREA